MRMNIHTRPHNQTKATSIITHAKLAPSTHTPHATRLSNSDTQTTTTIAKLGTQHASTTDPPLVRWRCTRHTTQRNTTDDTTSCKQRENADARTRNAHDTRAAAYRLHEPTPRQPPKTRREETRGEAPTGQTAKRQDERMRTR